MLVFAPLVWADDGAGGLVGDLLEVVGIDAGWQMDPNGHDGAEADRGPLIDPDGLDAGSAMDPNGLSADKRHGSRSQRLSRQTVSGEVERPG